MPHWKFGEPKFTDEQKTKLWLVYDNFSTFCFHYCEEWGGYGVSRRISDIGDEYLRPVGSHINPPLTTAADEETLCDLLINPAKYNARWME
jgi:hypothetical protein